MKIILELKELFYEWDAKHFGNKLGQVSLKFYSHRGRRHGFYRYGTLSGRSININMVNGTDQDKKQTLLHEMIHAYLHASGLPNGHTPRFKNMMRNLTETVFGFRPTCNVRFHFTAPQHITNPTPQVKPIATFTVPTMPMMPSIVATMAGNTPQRFKVLSTGKVGTFLRETTVYGLKHLVLTVEGCLFPFTTSADNVVPA